MGKVSPRGMGSPKGDPKGYNTPLKLISWIVTSVSAQDYTVEQMASNASDKCYIIKGFNLKCRMPYNFVTATLC